MKDIGNNIVNKIRDKLKEKAGSGPIVLTLVVVIIILMVMSILMEYFRCYVIVQGVSDALNKSCVSCGAKNSYNAYSGIRDTTGSLYVNDEGTWIAIIDTKDVKDMLCDYYSCYQEGTSITHYKIVKDSYDETDKYEYRIENLSIKVINPEYNASSGTAVKFEAKYSLIIPLMFLGDTPLKVTIPQTVTSEWLPKF